MDIPSFLNNWIAISNSYDTQAYAATFLPDAVLDDPSVGRKFIGHEGIRDYYTTYFIGYKTQTKFVKLEIHSTSAQLEVLFTGEFPGGTIGGTFDFTFRDQKIATVTAELI